MDRQEIAKQAAGEAAIDFVKSGMLIGLGTGSTTAFFIKSLIDRCKSGLKIKAVATSMRSYQQAYAGGIPLIDINTISTLDLTIDGADEIDGQKRMIKGGGGALLREKIVAAMSAEMIVIVDEKKIVQKLGKFPLPLEILPFGFRATLKHIEALGYKPMIRKTPEGEDFITDNGNNIFDIRYSESMETPEAENDRLLRIPGVIETGFFFNLAKKVIVGYDDGHVEIQ